MQKKIIIAILLLTFLSTLFGCQKRAEIDDGWKAGRYDFATNINRAEVDKIFYDLGTPSTQKILGRGWGENKKSADGRSYIKAQLLAPIIELPPMTLTSRVLYFEAIPFASTGVKSTYVNLYINGHHIKRIKLLPGWRTYAIPIKGRYFSLKGNILLFGHTFSYNNSKSLEREQVTKPSVAYDKLLLIRKEIANQEKNIKGNFVLLKQLKITGDIRDVLETRSNNQFSYQLSISNQAELHFSLGLSEEKVAKLEKIEYKILVKNNRSAESLLFSQSFHADKQQLCENWNEFKVDLTPYKDSRVSLYFKTHVVPKKDSKVDTICWGNPFVITPQNEGSRKLNVIVYLIDTLRADHLGCYGNPIIKTPNIDKFASEGVLFEQAFSQASWTKPSVASLFTSTYPSYHGAINKKNALTEQITTLAEILKDNGYHTTSFINNPSIESEFGFNQGFDSYVQTYYPLKDIPLYSHHMNKLILPWLEKNANTPFFLYVHTLDPHEPYNPPPPFNTMYDKNYKGSINGSAKTLGQILWGELKVSQRDIQHLEALYDGEVTINDLAFGEFIEKLKELQLYNRSLIILTSDHGEEFYEHNGVMHGRTLYEEQIHIPLIMRLPNHFPAGMKKNSMVRIIDTMPTILDLLNLSIPSQCQGESLFPLVRGERESIIDTIYSEQDFSRKMLQSVRGRRWKLISYPKTASFELFDLEKDPEEMYNVAAKYPEIANSLMEKLKRWHQEQIERRIGLRRPEVKSLSKETIKQLKALGYLNN